MHRYLSTDSGVACYACGIVLDYMSPDDPTMPYPTAPDSAADTLEDIARALAFGLCRPGFDGRAHHYVLEGIPNGAEGVTGYALQCAYDGARVTADTLPASVDSRCAGR